MPPMLNDSGVNIEESVEVRKAAEVFSLRCEIDEFLTVMDVGQNGSPALAKRARYICGSYQRSEFCPFSLRVL